MELITTVENANAVIALDGKLTVAAAPDLEAEIAALPEDVANVDFDLANLEYVASAGLRVIVAASKRCNGAGGRLRLLHPNEEVMEVFDATGLVEILNIEP
ncbi:MAG TPA: anti-sigma factor antagonist [Eggerthellaceae bacterium]|nr:anti-sigma factor antagonist [Eggerthellaceae bacterium]